MCFFCVTALLSTNDRAATATVEKGGAFILALAKELYGASFAQMVLELNASDGTRVAREGPRERSSDARTPP